MGEFNIIKAYQHPCEENYSISFAGNKKDSDYDSE
jgi:hypothetical protein